MNSREKTKGVTKLTHGESSYGGANQTEDENSPEPHVLPWFLIGPVWRRPPVILLPITIISSHFWFVCPPRRDSIRKVVVFSVQRRLTYAANLNFRNPYKAW